MFIPPRLLQKSSHRWTPGSGSGAGTGVQEYLNLVGITGFRRTPAPILALRYQFSCLKKHFKIPPNLPFPKGGETTSPFPALGRIRRGEEKGGLRGIFESPCSEQLALFKQLKCYALRLLRWSASGGLQPNSLWNNGFHKKWGKS
jgi:hypothetical protein